MEDDEVILRRDESPTGDKIEAGLKARGIKYRIKWQNPSDIMLPAIEVRGSLIETVPSIEFYFFSRLDQGRSVRGIKAIHPNEVSA